MIDKFGKALLTMFGIGYFKYAPGTIASFITCLTFYLLWSLFGIRNLFFPFMFFTIIIFIYSTILIDKFYKGDDAKEIVIDEFIGQSIPLLSMINIKLKLKLITTPFTDYPTEAWIFLSFVLFRFFDILKPFPINLIDKKIKNGFGVILDDIVAGIFAAISIYIILSWI